MPLSRARDLTRLFLSGTAMRWLDRSPSKLHRTPSPGCAIKLEGRILPAVSYVQLLLKRVRLFCAR